MNERNNLPHPPTCTRQTIRVSVRRMCSGSSPRHIVHKEAGYLGLLVGLLFEFNMGSRHKFRQETLGSTWQRCWQKIAALLAARNDEKLTPHSTTHACIKPPSKAQTGDTQHTIQTQTHAHCSSNSARSARTTYKHTREAHTRNTACECSTCHIALCVYLRPTSRPLERERTLSDEHTTREW